MLFCIPAYSEQSDAEILQEIEISSRLWTRSDWKHDGKFIKFGSDFTINKDAIEIVTRNENFMQIDLKSGRNFKVTTTASYISLPIIYRILSELLVEGQQTVLSGPDNEELKLFNLMERLSEGEQTRDSRRLLLIASLIHSRTLHWSDVSRWLLVEEM